MPLHFQLDALIFAKQMKPDTDAAGQLVSFSIHVCYTQLPHTPESQAEPLLTLFLREIPHGQILHPMPFYLNFGLSNFPEIRKN